MNWQMHFFYNRHIDKIFINELFTIIFNNGLKISHKTQNTYDAFIIALSDKWYAEDRINENKNILENRLSDYFNSYDENKSLGAFLCHPTDKGTLNFYMSIQRYGKVNQYRIFFENTSAMVIKEPTFLKLIDFWKELFVKLNFDYGKLITEYEGIDFDSNGAPKEGPNILDFYSQSLMDKIGSEKLLSTPAVKKEILGNGGIMIFISKEEKCYFERYRQVLGNLIKNIDFVAEEPDPYVWTYSIPAKALKLSQVNDELLNLLKKLMEITAGFFIPTHIKFIVLTFDNDYPVSERYCIPGVPYIDNIHREFESENGFSFQDIKDSFHRIETRTNVVKHLWRMEINGKTKFILNGKDIFIGENSPKDQYSYCYNDWIIDSSIWSPLEIIIDCTGCRRRSDISFIDLLYTINFRTGTDIWFDETIIGNANRARLDTIFKTLKNSFDVADEESFRS